MIVSYWNTIEEHKTKDGVDKVPNKLNELFFVDLSVSFPKEDEIIPELKTPLCTVLFT